MEVSTASHAGVRQGMQASLMAGTWKKGISVGIFFFSLTDSVSPNEIQLFYRHHTGLPPSLALFSFSSHPRFSVSAH